MSDSEIDLRDDDDLELEILQEPGTEVEINNSEPEDNQNINWEQEEVDNGENNENAADEDKKVKPKRVIRNPQPKLNSERLKGPRGLQSLESYFEKIKFKGHGHEEDDLNTLMKTYEYWCHRLFPKLPFDSCLAKIEQLGFKKEVQVHIKKIRMNMIVDDIVNQIEEDDEEEAITFPNIQTDEHDNLIPQIESRQIEEPIQLTAEQLEKIKANRERALILKLERLKKIQMENNSNIEHEHGGETSVNSIEDIGEE